jgi:2-hydroxy-3-keto-5-methylthiopentenyl-1-phosphate phosphatase
MSRPERPKIAICYDFDGTLSPQNMQEYDYIPQLGIKPAEFWKEAKRCAKEQEADEILAYLCVMLKKAKESHDVKITRNAFAECGKTVKLFPGVQKWFKRIKKYAEQGGAEVEHYIISSGLKEMIEGTKIAGEFYRVFASSFMYDQHGVAHWPAMAINFTTKTQFLFRINKGLLDAWDNSQINAYTPMADRRIPFNRMIYLGDGETDIPCMKLIKEQKGYSIAVYRPRSSKKKKAANKLLKEGRVNLACAADYQNGTLLDQTVKLAIDKIIADYRLGVERA